MISQTLRCRCFKLSAVCSNTNSNLLDWSSISNAAGLELGLELERNFYNSNARTQALTRLPEIELGLYHKLELDRSNPKPSLASVEPVPGLTGGGPSMRGVWRIPWVASSKPVDGHRLVAAPRRQVYNTMYTRSAKKCNGSSGRIGFELSSSSFC